MAPWSLVADAVLEVSLIIESFRTSKTFYPAWEVVSLRFPRKAYSDLRYKFGILQAVFLLIILPDAKDIVDRVEKHVLNASTDEPLMLRKSMSEDCTMLAVAAAIAAQVAITALGLQDLDKVHWTAEAAFVVSLAAGGLSVVCACLVQQRMSSLFTTDDVKNFFSKPNSSEKFRLLEKLLDQAISDMGKRNRDNEQAERHQRMTELESMIKVFKSKNKWKSASFPSILMVKAPTLLLKYALAAFIVGLGIYFGCLAFGNVDSQKPRGSCRAIFIVYVVTFYVGSLIYNVPSTMKELELAPARRYAQIMTNELVKSQHEEETDIIRSIGALLRSEEQEANGEHPSDDTPSCEGRLENMAGSQHNPPHDSPIEHTNKSADETTACARCYTV